MYRLWMRRVEQRFVSAWKPVGGTYDSDSDAMHAAAMFGDPDKYEYVPLMYGVRPMPKR